MTCTVSKIGDAGAAFAYYSERDDYYLSDTSSARWWGVGAAMLGLRGNVDPNKFHAVLTGKAGAQQVGREGFRVVKSANGTEKKIPNHAAGWDMTYSAPKSVSIAALLFKDERLTAGHDDAVRAAMTYVEQQIASRQRAADGGYEFLETGNVVAGIVRHSTSRNLDMQLHSHCVFANMTRADKGGGRWVSIDSRTLYEVQREAGNIYSNSLAGTARRAGYTVDWHVDGRGNANFELTEISEAMRLEFSSRRREIEAQLAAKGIDPEGASGAARQAATLDTRSAKEHLPGKELHARWKAQAEAQGYSTDTRPKGRTKPDAAQRMKAAREAVGAATNHLSERATRFTARQLIAEATTFAQGRAGQEDLARAVREAHESGELLDRGTQVRGHSKDLQTTNGYTTRAAMETEADMLRRAASITERAPSLSLTPGAVDSLIDACEQATGHAFTAEQRTATTAILEGRGGLAIVQGFAGTAKTTSVLATVADAARGANVRVRAIAPTHSAADTLGAAIGSESTTVAALTSKPLERDGRAEIWIVDEAGMVSASDMKTLLTRADQSGAQVILTGDTKQIGSVGAGSAFQQLQDAHPTETYSLTDIKRQSSAELKRAVYDALEGRFDDALNKVDAREIKDHEQAVAAIADSYIEQVKAGKQTLVVTLSRDDRDAVNSAIQQRREAAGEVRNAQAVATLTARQWTDAERADASRYEPGLVIEAGRDFKNGPRRGELVTVAEIHGGKVTATRANGETWTFDPARTNKFSVLERGETSIGAGDRITAKGAIYARDAGDPSTRIQIKNGTAMTVEDVAQGAGQLLARLDDGRRVAIDTAQGIKADLDYAQTANQAQGRTTDSVITWMRSSQTNIGDRQHAYVALSRAREKAIVITDDETKLAATLSKSAHGKETAHLARAEAQTQPGATGATGATGAAPATGMDEARPLSAWAKDLAADIKARIQNNLEDARARAREREQETWAKNDRRWLRQGDKLRSKIEHDGARREREIARKFGTNLQAGAIGRFFEGRAAKQGRAYIEQARAGRNSALNKINTSLDRAFERSVSREARANGISADAARERIAERTYIDRNHRVAAAVGRVGAWLAEAADAPRGGGENEPHRSLSDLLADRIAEMRAERAERAESPGSDLDDAGGTPTPFDTMPDTDREHESEPQAELDDGGPELDF